MTTKKARKKAKRAPSAATLLASVDAHRFTVKLLRRENTGLRRRLDAALKEIANLKAVPVSAAGKARLPPRRPLSTTAQERATEAWHGSPPGWVVDLAKACDASSQVKMGKALGISSATLNQVLGNRYRGRNERVEALFRAWQSSPSPDHPLTTP